MLPDAVELPSQQVMVQPGHHLVADRGLYTHHGVAVSPEVTGEMVTSEFGMDFADFGLSEADLAEFEEHRDLFQMIDPSLGDALERVIAVPPRLVEASRRLVAAGMPVEVVHWADGRIQRTTFAEFAGSASVQVAAYPDVSTFHPDEIEHRALSGLNVDGYDLFERNCEHFATWCVTGRWASAQVKDGGGLVAILSLILLPAPLKLVGGLMGVGMRESGEGIAPLKYCQLPECQQPYPGHQWGPPADGPSQFTVDAIHHWERVINAFKDDFVKALEDLIDSLVTLQAGEQRMLDSGLF